MSYALYAASVILVATYVLISARGMGRFRVDRPVAAMLGGAMMIAFGVVGSVEAIAAIDLDVLVLLLGMIILVAGLDACGFLGAAANVIVLQAASRQGVEVTFRDWFRAGFPVTVVTLVLATAFLFAFA